MSNQTTWDVVTFGETMLRLTPRGFERFEQSHHAELHVGGSESNTAAGLARLGHRACWLSRLTANPIGRLISNSIAACGVDTSYVIWTDEDRVGTYFLERGVPPRASEIFYDRANSAMSRVTSEDLPADFFVAERARYFHTTGITLGISESAANAAAAAAKRARDAGWIVSFDVNYRSRLWSATEAAQRCEQFIGFADLIFLPKRDAKALFDIHDEQVQSVCEQLHDRWADCTVIVTCGVDGASAIDTQSNYHYQPAYPAIEVERLGGGDAFAAGFLSAQLENKGIAESLRWGAAAAALEYTIHGDLPLFDRSMVEDLAGSSEYRSSAIQR